ncbi:MAG: energy-coupling factor transporter transmembrane component T [Lachnospiraceae bacterium]|nr:energy-coupling factor transporter transmembrane component T [Lachnospiraceae bacterium]
MMRDITIGQYYRADSPIHRLDPRVKLAGTFFFMISLFFQKSILTYVLAVLALVAVVKISRVPFSFMVRGLKPILYILLFSVLINMFFVPGVVIAKLWIFQITREGVIQAAFMGLRLIVLILGASLLTLTTTPNQLTDGLEKMFGCLKKIKIPVHEIAMMMSIALRFIPILTEETDKIMKAQMARGADLDSGNLIQKIKSMVPILVPLFVAAIRRANDLAMAMEAKCYNGSDGRTKMKPLVYAKADKTAYGIELFYIAAMIGLAFVSRRIGLSF